MSRLEPLVVDILFDVGGIIDENFFVDKLSTDIQLDQDVIRKSLQKLINKGKLHRIEDKYVSLTDFGETQENKINHLLNKLVYGKFLFLNPKLENGKEFCDNLIYFNGILLIFQSKTKDYTTIEQFDKFRTKCIDNAISQLNTSINWARNKILVKRFRNILGDEILIETEKITKIIGICVSYFHPDKDYFITKGNAVNLKNKEEIPNILTYQELLQIIELNDTLPEFIEYLDKRRILVQKNVPLLSEKTILSYFFTTNRTMIPSSMSEEDFNNCSLLIIDDDFEESLKGGELKRKLEERTGADKNSYFIDMIISKILPQLTQDDELIIDLLNLNRFQRRTIANHILPKYESFVKRHQEFRCPSISIDGIGYVFVFSRKYQDIRQNEELLKFYTYLTKKKHNLTKVIGISENHYTDGTVSHSACLIEGEVELDASSLPDNFEEMLNDKKNLKKIEGLYEFGP